MNPGVYLGLGPCAIQGVSFPVCTTNGNLNQRRVLSVSGENPASARLISNLDSHAAVGTQEYRGLKLSMQRRSVSGVNINANYTVSRCFGLEMVPNAQFGIGYINPADPDYDRGHCEGDRTHLANGTFGTHQRNSVRGPGFWKIDLAVSRLVSVASTQNLELRVEVFNLFNNFNWGNPNLNFSAGTFGRITTMAGDPRIIQFGIKYGF